MNTEVVHRQLTTKHHTTLYARHVTDKATSTNISLCVRRLNKIVQKTYKILNTPVPRYLSQRINHCVNAWDTTLDGYATAHPTICSHRLRETLFSMRCAGCLEFTSCVFRRKRLTVFKSKLKTFLFCRSFN